MSDAMLSQQILKEFLTYNPDTGVFIWRMRADKWFVSEKRAAHWNSRFANTQAGSFIKRGYRQISILGTDYLAQNLAWLYVHNRHPIGMLDHQDHKKDNNRINNLRETDKAGNCKNRTLSKNSKTGCSGVTWQDITKKWHVQIGNGKGKHRGSYNTLFEAVCVRKAAELKGGYHENHGKPIAD